jgi:hypothetical protein
MLRISHDLMLTRDSQKVSVLVLLDLSAAFDTVDHVLLLQRLANLGITDAAHHWLTSYLEDRHQCVLVDSVQSTNENMKWGVPQGSVLGPILFTLFTSELGELIRRHGFECHFYADDTQIYGSFSVEEVQLFVRRLEDCLSEVVEWMSCNYLCLNDAKTELLLIGTAVQLRKLSFPPVKIGSALIHPSSTARSLGVKLDAGLKLKEHVAAACKSSWYHLRTIAKVRPCLSQTQSEQLIHALVMSRIDYCNGLLAGARKADLDKLQRIMNAAARIVCLIPKATPITNVLRELHWLKIPERVIFKLALLVFKALTGTAPEYIKSLISIRLPSRTLRSSSGEAPLLQFPMTNLRATDAAFGVAAPKAWNGLPVHVRSIKTLTAFKTALKTFLFSRSYPPQCLLE